MMLIFMHVQMQKSLQNNLIKPELEGTPYPELVSPTKVSLEGVTKSKLKEEKRRT